MLDQDKLDVMIEQAYRNEGPLIDSFQVGLLSRALEDAGVSVKGGPVFDGKNPDAYSQAASAWP